MVNQGFQQLLHHNDAGHGVAGNTQNGLGPLAAQNGGLAGLHGNAVVQDLPQLPDDSGGIVLPPGRGTGVENHHVTFRCGSGNHGLDLVKFVGNDGINHRVGTPAFHHGGENGAVKFQNVSGLGVRAGGNNFVAGGDDPHHRLGNHFDFQHTAGNHSADGGGGNGHMAGQNHLSGTHILANLPDVLPGSGSGMDGDGAILVLHDVLHHDDGIPVLGDRVAGIQHNILLLLQGNRGGFGGAEGISGAYGYTVHGAGGIVGRTDMGVDRPGGHTATGFIDGNHFGSWPKALLLQQLPIVSACLLQRHIGQIFKSHFFILLNRQLLVFRRFWEVPRNPGQCRSSHRPLPKW